MLLLFVVVVVGRLTEVPAQHLYCSYVSELVSEWRQLDSDIQLSLQPSHSVTFNATDELKVDLLQSTLNLTPHNWVTAGSHRSRDTCHVQLTGDDCGFMDETAISRQVTTITTTTTTTTINIKNYSLSKC